MDAPLEIPRVELIDEGTLKEWPAPGGVLVEPGGLRATFDALRMRSVVDTGGPGGEVRFEAWRTPRLSGAVVSAILAVAVYLTLDHFGATEVQTIVAVVIVAFYVPTWIVPGYRVSGRISEGKVHLRVVGKGLLARPMKLEQALRFYLQRAS